jgi:hypothetical protein
MEDLKIVTKEFMLLMDNTFLDSVDEAIMAPDMDAVEDHEEENLDLMAVVLTRCNTHGILTYLNMVKTLHFLTLVYPVNMLGVVPTTDDEFCNELRNLMKEVVRFLHRKGVSKEQLEHADGTEDFLCLVDHFNLAWTDGLEDARERLRKNKAREPALAGPAKKIKQEEDA